MVTHEVVRKGETRFKNKRLLLDAPSQVHIVDLLLCLRIWPSDFDLNGFRTAKSMIQKQRLERNSLITLKRSLNFGVVTMGPHEVSLIDKSLRASSVWSGLPMAVLT
jgi:hypothetical protein